MPSLESLDAALAGRYGAYASYSIEGDPVLVESCGDAPGAEVDRLVDLLARPGAHVLDLGCGAGFTVCRLAPRVEAIWGLDVDADLLAAAHERVKMLAIDNATLAVGNSADPDDVARLPDAFFDLVLSRRGPNVNAHLLPKLRADALVVQELWQDPLGLLELFGRKTFTARIGDNRRWLVDKYSWLGLRPVSIKEYYVDLYFRDAEHLAAYLSLPTQLYSYPMPPIPYRKERDRQALELYVLYNSTPKGVRVINHHHVYLFRRERVQYAPVDPDLEPLE